MTGTVHDQTILALASSGLQQPVVSGVNGNRPDGTSYHQQFRFAKLNICEF